MSIFLSPHFLFLCYIFGIYELQVAVEGCSHGELDLIYEKVLARERQEKAFFDVLLLCGDFQAIRNHADLHSLAVPEKYRQLGSFWQYYAGVKRAPLLTLVIGGNHEASNYMYELYYGGWLAPNIYFLGEAGCVDVGDLIISGISGIYKKHDYYRGRYERQPYNKNDLRSIYHTRLYDIERLKLLPKSDIVMSHDWPNTIEQHGATQDLIKKKPFFAEEIRTETLGSPPLLDLLQTLKPTLWCSAHLHVRFDAVYHHDSSGFRASGSKQSGPAQISASVAISKAAADPNQISIDDFDDSDDEMTAPVQPQTATDSVKAVKDFGDGEEPLVPVNEVGTAVAPEVEGSTTALEEVSATEDEGSAVDAKTSQTTFLALGKCVNKQTFLEFFDTKRDSNGNLKLSSSSASTGTDTLDPAKRRFPSLRFHAPWLAIVRALHPWLSLEAQQAALPSVDEIKNRIDEANGWIEQNTALSGTTDGPSEGQRHALDVGRIQQFVPTAPPPPPESLRMKKLDLRRIPPTPPLVNPQTAAFCDFVGIDLRINTPIQGPPQLLEQSKVPQILPAQSDS
ncbi:lariat debranching enzyme [Tilletia horrida]|uniref:Lariat debranching enzyme n=1 Tax=Tilletia horrida TaxID=155126 RepID=A0AAN6JSJ3_9BASI|nr:lariat debranching enzyme [Tilletia horrida]